MSSSKLAIGDGTNRTVRAVGIAVAVVAAIGVAAATFLDGAAKDGTLERIAGGKSNDLNTRLAQTPRPTGPAIPGVRYGNTDYTPTASIPADQQRVKNVVSDPRLGMPD